MSDGIAKTARLPFMGVAPMRRPSARAGSEGLVSDAG